MWITLKILVGLSGVVFLAMVILSFTDYPFEAYHWLGTHESKITGAPDYIVVMGAGGMPGPEGLMRSHYAAEAAKAFPDADVIIALPTGHSGFFSSDAYKMFLEIARQRIDPGRFLFETHGTNTHSQACGIKKLLDNQLSQNLLIITSPEHMYRCILTFKKCGFAQVSGLPTFGAAFNDDLLLTDGERNQNMQSIDRSIDFRYNMWNYLKLQISIIREGIALAWYKLKGYV